MWGRLGITASPCQNTLLRAAGETGKREAEAAQHSQQTPGGNKPLHSSPVVDQRDFIASLRWRPQGPLQAWPSLCSLRPPWLPTYLF